MNLRQVKMTVQEYGLKFNKLSRYALHMVADSKVQINNFFYGVSDLVKIDCRNSMLLEDMKISRPITHAQMVDGDKLREHAKENKKARSGGGNSLQSQQKFSALLLWSAVIPSSKNRYDKKVRAQHPKSHGSFRNQD